MIVRLPMFGSGCSAAPRLGCCGSGRGGIVRRIDQIRLSARAVVA
jgi:hypothetical protein